MTDIHDWTSHVVVVELPASATAADITGTWELTIYYQPDDSDYLATYVLKQEGEKVTGTYHGLHGPADVTGTVKSNDVTERDGAEPYRDYGASNPSPPLSV
jgi:hypothetical protein